MRAPGLLHAGELPVGGGCGHQALHMVTFNQLLAMGCWADGSVVCTSMATLYVLWDLGGNGGGISKLSSPMRGLIYA